MTLTTVGYGDVYPVTPKGRIAATVLLVLGIGLFSVITATMTSALLGAGSKESAAPPETRLRQLESMRTQGLISEQEYADKRAEVIETL